MHMRINGKKFDKTIRDLRIEKSVVEWDRVWCGVGN